MKSIIYSRLYLKDSKVCKKLKMRDMCSMSTSAHWEKLISVELTVDLRAIYTRFWSVFVCRCQKILVCAHLKIYTQRFLVVPAWLHLYSLIGWPWNSMQLEGKTSSFVVPWQELKLVFTRTLKSTERGRGGYLRLLGSYEKIEIPLHSCDRKLLAVPKQTLKPFLSPNTTYMFEFTRLL